MNKEKIKDYIKDGVYYIEDKPVKCIPLTGRLLVKFPPIIEETRKRGGLYLANGIEFQDAAGNKKQIPLTYDLLQGCTIVAVPESEKGLKDELKVGDRVHISNVDLQTVLNGYRMDVIHPLFDDTVKRLSESLQYGYISRHHILCIIEKYQGE